MKQRLARSRTRNFRGRWIYIWKRCRGRTWKWNPKHVTSKAVDRGVCVCVRACARARFWRTTRNGRLLKKPTVAARLGKKLPGNFGHQYITVFTQPHQDTQSTTSLTEYETVLLTVF